MACKKPVVATSIGGLPYTVGDCGIIVPPGDVDALRDAISRLITDTKHAHLMGERGYRRVIENFTWKRVAEDNERLYSRIMKRKQYPIY